MQGKLDHLERNLNRIAKELIKVIIICDNYEDGTWEKLITLVNNFETERFTLIMGHYGAPGIARNAGMQNVDTKWIAFWDADDLVDIEAIKSVLQKPSSHLVDLICGQYKVYSDTRRMHTYFSTAQGSNRENLLRIGFEPGIWRFIFDSNLIRESRFEQGKMGEDQEFLFKILLKEPTLQINKECFYTYFTADSNHLTSNNAHILDLFEARKRMSNLLEGIKQNQYRDLLTIILFQTGLSLLKRAPFSVRLTTLLMICKEIRKSKFSFQVTILYAIMREKKLRRATR